MTVPDSVQERIDHYQETRRLSADRQLGVGTQGSVLLFDDPSLSHPVAVKFHERLVAYNRELAVFYRLQDLEIDQVGGHEVPVLLGHDDDLLAIEMTMVRPPFVLDFGGAYLDRRPDYTPEVWRDWREQKSEEFDDDWPAVEELLLEFESFGIFIADVNPGNIKFE